MTKIPYHSALAKGQLEDAEALPSGVVHFDHRENSVQVWDINSDPIPEEFRECDLIYAEPAFPAGMAIFDERAGAKHTQYDVYATNFGRIIRELGKPTVMFLPDRALKFLPPPDFTTKVDLNGNLTMVAFWNGAFALGGSNKDLIRGLACEYNRVGDFCCGYGTTGRLFIEAGKNCVLSDYNPLCCGYVADHMEGWG